MTNDFDFKMWNFNTCRYKDDFYCSCYKPKGEKCLLMQMVEKEKRDGLEVEEC